jgi:hypothetical protein
MENTVLVIADYQIVVQVAAVVTVVDHIREQQKVVPAARA